MNQHGATHSASSKTLRVCQSREAPPRHMPKDKNAGQGHKSMSQLHQPQRHKESTATCELSVLQKSLCVNLAYAQSRLTPSSVSLRERRTSVKNEIGRA